MIKFEMLLPSLKSSVSDGNRQNCNDWMHSLLEQLWRLKSTGLIVISIKLQAHEHSVESITNPVSNNSHTAFTFEQLFKVY